DLLHVADADRCIHRADMDHASVLHSMQPDVAGKRPRMIEVEEKAAIGLDARFGLLAELGGLPLLPLVLAQVLDDEEPDALDGEEALVGGMDGEASEVAGDPAPSEFFGDGCCRAGTAEAVQHQIALIRRRLDDT